MEVEIRHKGTKSLLVTAALTLMLFGAGCKKKVAAPTPPPPPAPAAPSVAIIADPSTIESGQSSMLRWTTENATDVTLDGKTVERNGSKSVTPSESTTYQIVAKGPGGSQEAAGRVTVTIPPPSPAPVPGPGDEELFARNVGDIFFDYDKYELRPAQTAALETSARWLAEHKNVRFKIEGHCDERGSAEYNLALGDNRANSVKTALLQAGVAADRIETISYGKERPSCNEATEACWQQNRRGHFVYQR